MLLLLWICEFPEICLPPSPLFRLPVTGHAQILGSPMYWLFSNYFIYPCYYITVNRDQQVPLLYLLPKKEGLLKLLSLTFVTIFLLFSMSVGLFLDHVEHVEYSVEPPWCVQFYPCCRLLRPLAPHPYSCFRGPSRMTRMSLCRPVSSLNDKDWKFNK